MEVVKWFAEEIMLNDDLFVELTKKLTHSSFEQFRGRKSAELEQLHEKGILSPKGIEYLELLEVWHQRISFLKTNHFEKCFRASRSL